MNNTEIAAAKPGAVLFDDKVRGLHLRCFGTAEKPGKKVFYLIYRDRARRHQRRPKIGTLGDVTLAQARDHARKMLNEVAAGRDPMAERRARQAEITFGQLCDRYLEHVRTDPREKKKSADEDGKLVERFLRPKWGRLPAKDVTREDVEKLHADLAGTPIQANRVLSLISRMCNLGERWRVRDEHTNPARLVQRYVERKRRRIMSRDEAPAIAEALAREGARSPQSVLFIYLLLYTGARPDEIERATWNDIHIDVFEDNGERVERWSLRLMIHKTDDGGDVRTIALPPRVVDLLRDRPRTEGSIVGVGAAAAAKLWRKVRKAAGCHDLRLYDLRRGFASAGLRAGYTLDQIGQTLGHTDAATTRRYAWLADELRAEVAGQSADVIASMMVPKKALPAPAKEGGAS